MTNCTNRDKLSLFSVATPSHILPTNLTTMRHPFHRWFNFVAGFSPEFVSECMSSAGLNHKSQILDPFSGCGTTLVEANLEGIASFGFEAHPFLCHMCESKLLVDADPEIIEQLFGEMSELHLNIAALAPYSPNALTFLKKLVPEESLSLLATARQQLQSYKGHKFTIGKMMLSKVLDLCSHSKTDGIYKAPTSKKKAVSFIDALTLVAETVVEDLRYAKHRGLVNKSQVACQSSQDMSCLAPDSCDLLVTSPPYLNNFDYAEMTRMYHYFWLEAANWGEITAKIRSKLIVNTTTALKGHKDKIESYRTRTPECVKEELNGYMLELAEKRKVKAGKKDYDYLIYPYFAQMTDVLRSTTRVLKRNAPVHIIVSDAALYGIHIRTQVILAKIMETLGFTDLRIDKLRSRGTRWILEKREGSDEGLGEYHISSLAS